MQNNAAFKLLLLCINNAEFAESFSCFTHSCNICECLKYGCVVPFAAVVYLRDGRLERIICPCKFCFKLGKKQALDIY